MAVENIYLELGLLGNQLKTLPAQIGQLKNLSSLSLDKNPIQSLPDLSNLKQLSHLSFDFKQLPVAEVEKLKNSLLQTSVSPLQVRQLDFLK